jgi:hypothetical protein
MRNPQEYKPRIEIKGDNLILTAHDYSKLRRVKEMLTQNDFDVIIIGIQTEKESLLKIA